MVSFIDAHRDAHGVEPICEVLPIAPSTYYDHLARRADPARLSDRARRDAALRTEINQLGGNVAETADGLIIDPAPLHGGLFHSYDDHRMATAGAIIGLRVADVSVENIGTTAKTLPDFSRMWTTLVNHGA